MTDKSWLAFSRHWHTFFAVGILIMAGGAGYTWLKANSWQDGLLWATITLYWIESLALRWRLLNTIVAAEEKISEET